MNELLGIAVNCVVLIHIKIGDHDPVHFDFIVVSLVNLETACPHNKGVSQHLSCLVVVFGLVKLTQHELIESLGKMPLLVISAICQELGLGPILRKPCN